MSAGGTEVEQALACLATLFCDPQGWGGLMKMAERRRIGVDAASQSCHTIVTSPACGRGRGLSRGRGPGVDEEVDFPGNSSKTRQPSPGP